MRLVVLSFLLMAALPAFAVPSLETKRLAKELYSVFVLTAKKPEMLAKCGSKGVQQQIQFAAQNAGSQLEGIDKLGASGTEKRATLWLLGKKAQMTGRTQLSTLEFERSPTGSWGIVGGQVEINSLEALPNSVILKCQFKPSQL